MVDGGWWSCLSMLTFQIEKKCDRSIYGFIVGWCGQNAVVVELLPSCCCDDSKMTPSCHRDDIIEKHCSVATSLQRERKDVSRHRFAMATARFSWVMSSLSLWFGECSCCLATRQRVTSVQSGAVVRRVTSVQSGAVVWGREASCLASVEKK